MSAGEGTIFKTDISNVSSIQRLLISTLQSGKGGGTHKYAKKEVIRGFLFYE